jgi:hypothetical protein
MDWHPCGCLTGKMEGIGMHDAGPILRCTTCGRTYAPRSLVSQDEPDREPWQTGPEAHEPTILPFQGPPPAASLAQSILLAQRILRGE